MGHYKNTYFNIIWQKYLIITYIKIDIYFYTAKCSNMHLRKLCLIGRDNA